MKIAQVIYGQQQEGGDVSEGEEKKGNDNTVDAKFKEKDVKDVVFVQLKSILTYVQAVVESSSIQYPQQDKLGRSGLYKKQIKQPKLR